MLKIFIAILVGIGLTACEFDSDPTRNTTVNHKNTQFDRSEKVVTQGDASQCFKLIDLEIPPTHVIEIKDESKQTTSNTPITARLLNVPGADYSLSIVENENTPFDVNDISINKSSGSHSLLYTPQDGVFEDGSHHSKFTITVSFRITQDENNSIGDNCGIFEKDIVVHLIKKTNEGEDQ